MSKINEASGPTQVPEASFVSGNGKTEQYPEFQQRADEWQEEKAERERRALEGPALLDEYVRVAGEFFVAPEGALEMLAVWNLYTYCWHEFHTTGYVRVKSNLPDTGKTTVLEAGVEPWACQPVVSMGGGSGAAMRNVIHKMSPVVTIDESDAQMSNQETAALVTGILNNGYKRGKHYLLSEPGGDIRIVRVFCPKVIAGMGRLADATETRCINVVMRKLLPTEHVKSTFEDGDYLSQTAALWRERAERWTAEHIGAIRSSKRTRYPEGIRGRRREVWHPLLVVADVVGGDWPERIRAAATALERPRAETERENLNLTVLRDVRDCWKDLGEPEFLPSAELLAYLNQMEERPWRDWQLGLTASRLAKFLKEFGVVADRKQERQDGQKSSIRGYKAEDLRDPWERNL